MTDDYTQDMTAQMNIFIYSKFTRHLIRTRNPRNGYLANLVTIDFCQVLFN